MSIDEQIDRSLDGQLDDDEWRALQQRVVADPEVRRRYVERRWLHARLLADGAALPGLIDAGSNAAQRDRGVSPVAARFLWLNAAAALVLLGLVAAMLWPNGELPSPPTVATLVEARNCRWDGSELPTKEGAKLGAGTLALAEGMATIRFDSGATVTLEAPTVLEVESAMRCELIEGSVVAEVPESAHGFVIDTRQMEVIDLGTRFGVTANDLGGAHVFVFDGEVEVQRDGDEEVRRLLTGTSMHVGSESAAAARASSEEDEVARQLRRAAARPGDWQALSTDRGRGRDAFIRRGDAHRPTGGQPLLMVKHTDLVPGNERRALLTFDLAALDENDIADAVLALKVENSGLGFAALVPDSRFAIYGVLDAAIDDWREDGLRWGNAAEALTGDLTTAEGMVKLAEFDIVKGAPHDLVEVRSDALTGFLRERRPDGGSGGGIATLLLVRETGEHDRQGLVHAFASKEHPTGPPPTLWIRSDSQNDTGTNQ